MRAPLRGKLMTSSSSSSGIPLNIRLSHIERVVNNSVFSLSLLSFSRVVVNRSVQLFPSRAVCSRRLWFSWQRVKNTKLLQLFIDGLQNVLRVIIMFLISGTARYQLNHPDCDLSPIWDVLTGWFEDFIQFHWFESCFFWGVLHSIKRNTDKLLTMLGKQNQPDNKRILNWFTEQ